MNGEVRFPEHDHEGTLVRAENKTPYRLASSIKVPAAWKESSAGRSPPQEEDRERRERRQQISRCVEARSASQPSLDHIADEVDLWALRRAQHRARCVISAVRA